MAKTQQAEIKLYDGSGRSTSTGTLTALKASVDVTWSCGARYRVARKEFEEILASPPQPPFWRLVNPTRGESYLVALFGDRLVVSDDPGYGLPRTISAAKTELAIDWPSLLAAWESIK